MSDDENSVKVEEEEEVDYDDITDSNIQTKYRLAADIANLSLKGVLTQCVEGKDVAQICTFGDSLIMQQCAKSFKSKKIEKGIAFPTCVSINDCVCNFSPLAAESRTLKNGDVVKIDLGCHIDGYVATVGHTVVVGGEADEKTADCIAAAYTGLQVAYKLARPGTKSSAFTEALTRVAEEYGVSGLSGTLSHQMQRFVIDGAKAIKQVDDPEHKVEDCEIEEGDVMQLDVCMTTGEGKMRAGEERCTVFKREVDTTYKLKMKASRYVLTEVTKNFSTLPFTLRAFSDEKQARLGVVECTKHDLLEPYHVMYDKAAGSVVARFKCTVLITKNQTAMITGLPLPDTIKSEKTAALSDDTKAILAKSSKTKKKRGKKKKKKAAEAAAAAAAAEAPAAE